MKLKSIVLALIIPAMLSCLASIAIAGTTWQSIGPFGGEVRTIAIDPTNSQTIYVGTFGGGLFKSSNGGALWTAANNGITNLNIQSIVIDPINSQTIYVGTYGGSGVFKTTNGGTSWIAANSGITNTSVYSLAIDPTNSQTVYVGTWGGGVFKSTNGGASWTSANSGMTNTSVNSLAVDPTNSQTLYVVTWGGGVFKTINGGASWISANSGITNMNIRSLSIDPTNSQTVYVGTYGELFKSTNGGASWTTASSGMAGTYVYYLAIDPTNSQLVYAGTSGGVFKSTNGGGSWTSANSGMTNSSVNVLAIDPTNSQIVYAGAYSDGIFKSTNSGSIWTATNSGVTNIHISAIAIDPTNSQIVYVGTSYGLFKSTNGGASWAAANNGITIITVKSLAIDPTNSQTVYVGTSSGLFKSTNGGASWTAVNSGITNTDINSFGIDSTNSQTVYAGTSSGVFKSIDGGVSWRASNSGITNNLIVYSLAIDPTNSQTIYAMVDGGLFKSTNGGTSWTASNIGITGITIKSLAIDPTNSETVYVGTYSGLFKSTNGGVSWTAANSGITNTYAYSLAIDPANSQIIYAGTSGVGVYKSTNGGASWTAANNGMTNIYVWSLVIDPFNRRTVYAGTGGSSVFKAVSSDAPVITSATTTTFTAETSGSFYVTASSSPVSTFSVSGSLPSGLSFNPLTGVLDGTPAVNSVGTYQLLFTATNGIPPDATRGVTLTVLPPSPLSVVISTPSSEAKLVSLSSITGTASGTGLSKVEVQVLDGIYYLQANGTFSTSPIWLTTSGTTSWSLNTSNAAWVGGITYSINARVVDGTGNTTIPVSSTFKILAAAGQAYTTISLDFTPSNLKSGDTTIVSGRILRLPDNGSSLAGLNIKLIITPPSTVANPTPSPNIIPLSTDSNGNYISSTLNLFSIPGVYMTQIRFDGTASLAASFTVPQPLYVNIQSGYAIVLVGKSPDNSLINLHTNSTDTIVATLKKRGFLDDNINYLKSTAAATVTKQQVQDAITSWARDKLVTAPAPLYLIMIDHGTPGILGGFVLGDVTLTPDDLKEWMETLENDSAVIASGTLSNFNRIVLIGTCYSGEFIPKLSKPGRVIVTSAGTDEESLAGVNVYGINSGSLYGGEFFIDTLFTFLGRGNSFKDAFMQARGAVSIRDPRRVNLGLHSGVYDTLAQHPLLDDNGDGTPHYDLAGTGEGTLVASLMLGEGIKVNALSSPADIKAVTPTTILNPSTSTRQLWLQVNLNSRVARAWAEIRPPDSQTSGGGSGQVIPSFYMIPLIYDGQNWIGDYSNFTTPGKYDIFYYTIDNQTNEISPAAHSVVYKQLAGNAAPSAFGLISPDNMGTTDSTFVFNWQKSTDTDGLTYTLLVSTDNTFSNIIYREENIPIPATYILENTLKDPASANGEYYCQNGDAYCYWKVQAVDKFGAITESNVRSFTVVLTSGIVNSIVTGTILNTTGISLTSATLQIGTGPDQGLISGGNGVYMFGTPTTGGTTSTTITAIASGYKPRTIPISMTGGNVVNTSIYLEPETPQHTLGVTVTGTGSGTVNSVPTGIACGGTGAGCSTTYNNGTVLTLTAFPSSTSMLSTWGGACSGKALSCEFTLNADTNVSANFIAMPPVKQPGTVAAYFDTITNAYTSCPIGGNVTFQTMARAFNENVTLGRNINVTLQGGFDGSFASAGGDYSIIHGVLTVKQGRLTVRNVVVR